MLAERVESLSMFGACKAISGVVLRTRPSILATDVLSESGMRREDFIFCGSRLLALSGSRKRYEFDPPAHPRPNTATNAPATSQALRPRLPSSAAETAASSRL